MNHLSQIRSLKPSVTTYTSAQLYGDKLTLKKVANICSISIMTAKRLYTQPINNKTHHLYDPTFPKPEKFGRSIYIDSDAFYQWLSIKAGFTVIAPDKTLNSKQVREIFDKSHTWIWQNIKKGSFPKPFKIGRLNFWMQSQFINSKYCAKD